jgi:hypothetical protein
MNTQRSVLVFLHRSVASSELLRWLVGGMENCIGQKVSHSDCTTDLAFSSDTSCLLHLVYLFLLDALPLVLANAVWVVVWPTFYYTRIQEQYNLPMQHSAGLGDSEVKK